MEIIIRDALQEDMTAVHGLITELAVFEKEPEAVEVSIEDLERDGFGEQPLFHCFVAEVDNQMAGIALVYPRYSTWRGPVVHLEDLIVTQSMRGKGVGTSLLERVMEYGLEQGVRRIGWEVLDWNTPAIRFYENCGATIRKDWKVVQMDAQAMKNYLKRK